jgi:hypothetical protein
LIIYGFTSRSSYGDITIAGEWLQNLGLSFKKLPIQGQVLKNSICLPLVAVHGNLDIFGLFSCTTYNNIAKNLTNTLLPGSLV